MTEDCPTYTQCVSLQKLLKRSLRIGEFYNFAWRWTSAEDLRFSKLLLLEAHHSKITRGTIYEIKGYNTEDRATISLTTFVNDGADGDRPLHWYKQKGKFLN